MTYTSMRLLGLVMLIATASVAEAVPRAYQEGPHPVQGLEAFMERHGEKPYALFAQPDGSLVMPRLIFQDKQFGTEVWMIDDSPTVDHAGTASIWSAWNGNGATLYVEGTRSTGTDTHRGWFCDAGFSRLRPAPGERPAVWAPEDPEVYYAPASPSDKVVRTNWRTGEQTTVATWPVLSWPASGKRIYGITTDNRHIFVDLPNRGIFVPFTHDPDHPIPVLPLYDGRPIGPGGESVGSNHFTVIYDHDTYGDLIALRTGMLIDRETGERTHIAAPLCGNANYLRAFYENRVQFPEGDEWNAYGLPWFAEEVQLPTGLDMEELYALWRNLPHVTHGHESPSPDWEYIATDGGTTRIAHVRSGDTEEVRLSPDGSNYHLHWHMHPRFFVGWVRGWHYGRYARPRNGNIVYQVFADLTAQPVFDTNHRFNGYYAGGDFSMQSPDATKVHTASSMTGRFRNYIAVMARPRPPEQVAWQEKDGAVLLTWTPAAYSRETQGYLVYRSEQSGDGYQLQTTTPVTETVWRDTTAAAGTPYYYVVTALEHAGLESRYSAEAARAGIGLDETQEAPLRVYVEAEDALWTLGTSERPGLAVGVDRRNASDWHYVYRHPDADVGRASMTGVVPAAAAYHVWARLRSDGDTTTMWTVTIDDTVLEGETATDTWTWAKLSDAPVMLSNEFDITFATSDADAALDALVFATDDGFVPEGPRPEGRTAPSAVSDLSAANIRARANQLQWEASASPELSHYQVYVARQPFEQPKQKHLIGSPVDPAFIDWGLRPGETYHYAVTAVDRRRNESAPVFASAATPARTTAPAAVELAFADGEREGAFEVSTAGGLRGDAYVVPQSPEDNRVSWTVEIPRPGVYYLWLRYLHRGSGRRGDEVSHDVRVLLNGEKLTTLGGRTDLHVPDTLIEEDHPLAPRLWTWAWPGEYNLEGVELSQGRHTLELENLHEEIRYDVLFITDEPSFQPEDGRLRQR